MTNIPPPPPPPTGPVPTYPPPGVVPPDPTEGRRWKTWHLLAATSVALLIGIGAGAAGKSNDSTKAVAVASSSASTTSTTTSTTSSTTTTTASTTTTTTLPPEPVVVGDFSGSSDKSTETFTVVGTWTLSWEVTGGAGVGYELVDATTNVTIDRASVDPGQDQTIIRKGCTCYLKLSPFGSTYHFVVTDIPN